jgi:ElaB/YqjD/DUF883 family membrane-anchored ribosome-binding protein
MDRTFVDVGHRVETSPGSDHVVDITRPASSRGEVGGTVGAELAKSREALQGALSQAAGAIGQGIKDRTDGVIAYARREPVSALGVAAGVGMLVGLCVAIGSRGAAGGKGHGLSLSFLGRRAGPGWRRFLRLE